MPTKTATAIDHEHFCQPTAGRQEIRTERFNAPRPGADGISTVATVSIERCLECGAATYDGVRERELGTRRATITPAPPAA